MSAVQPLTSQFFGPAAAATGSGGTSNGTAINPGQTAFLNGPATASGGDGVRLSHWSAPGFSPTGTNAGASPSGQSGGGGFLGLIQNLIGQLTAAINGMNSGAGSAAPTTQNVADANFASTGDPHLSETGTVHSGSGTSSVDTHFDSMSGHTDLLDSSDFAGGYQLSTTVTSPNAKGVTTNQSATVSLNNGRDSVSLNKDGSCSIVSDGTALSIADGESVQLAGGAQVARGANGALTITESNANGGSITTSLAAQSYGVDVNAQVHNATVGGDIVSHTAQPPAPVQSQPPVQTQAGSTSQLTSFTSLGTAATATDQDWLDPQLSPIPQIPDYEPVSFA